MSSPGCALYAELLANIRQISVAASLSSPSDASTQVSVSADGRIVHLVHRGERVRLTLPGKSAVGGTLLPIQDAQRGTAALSWRLPADEPSLPSRQPGIEHTPWSATDLDAGSGTACRQCGTAVVAPGSVKAWKDLPSENWAEMMEFWHCHKPDHQHGRDDTGKADDKTLAARGYGASSAIAAQEGVGFVDLTSILFSESDCRNLTYSWFSHDQGAPDSQALVASADAATPSRNLNVFCSSCRAQLGFFNLRASAVTLLKWQILCKSVSGAAPSAPECLAATLISTVARSGSSKSLITPMPETMQQSEAGGQHVLHIWMLNSSIVFSSSGAAQCMPAIKLLFRSIAAEEADRMLASVTCDSQEINLPAQAIRDVARHLEESSALLPPAERAFKGWRVGLLTKWEARTD